MATTSRTATQIARRGQNICPIDESIPAFVARQAKNPLYKTVATERVVVERASRRAGRAKRDDVAADVFIADALAEENPYENNPIGALREIVNEDALHRLAPDLQKAAAEWFAMLVARNPAMWDALPLETKVTIDLLAMDYVWDKKNDPLEVTCMSIRSGKIYTIQYIPGKIDPLDGVTVCDPECIACKHKRECHHLLWFRAKFLPQILAWIAQCIAKREASDDTAESRSMYTQERSADSGRLCDVATNLARVAESDPRNPNDF